jgi:hypothetical protein
LSERFGERQCLVVKTFVTLTPDGMSVADVDELRANRELFLLPLDTTGEHPLHPQLAGDLAKIERLAFVALD